MIVSASRRTDVPGFHSRWFLRRIRAGWCHWVHPYTAEVRRVSLTPADVRAIVFWTRHPGPLLAHVPALAADGYTMLFQFTINGYGPPLETHNPPWARAIADAEAIAAHLGPHAVLWRFDPILLSERLVPAYHLDRFRRLASRLRGVTRQCTISFVDFYGKTRRNLASIEREQGHAFSRPTGDEQRELAAALADVAAEHDMRLLSCCDDALVHGGVGKARCIDVEAVVRAKGRAGPPPAERPGGLTPLAPTVAARNRPEDPRGPTCQADRKQLS